MADRCDGWPAGLLVASRTRRQEARSRTKARKEKRAWQRVGLRETSWLLVSHAVADDGSWKSKSEGWQNVNRWLVAGGWATKANRRANRGQAGEDA